MKKQGKLYGIRRWISLFFIGFVGFACSSEAPEWEQGKEEAYPSEHAMSKEEAVVVAGDFMEQLQEAFLNGASQGDASLRSVTINVSRDDYQVSTLNKVVTVKDSTGKTRNEQIPLYQINYKDAQGQSAGYAVVVGDERFEEKVIAFNDEDSCTVFTSPDAPFWTVLIENYLHYVANEGKKKEVPSLRAISLPHPDYAMALGVVTKWNQDDFYASCARFALMTAAERARAKANNEIDTIWKRGYAGCVAVAMGTIMAWHKWPSKGVYRKQINSPLFGGAIETVTTSYTTQNWTDIYNSALNPMLNNTHKAHIANLLAEIGYKLDMDYDSTGSGAFSTDAILVFNNMGYTCGSLSAYSSAEIADEIYNNKRPVYMDGSGNGSAHAFVISGMAWKNSQPAYMYIISGWGGSRNGWYSTALTGENMYTDYVWKYNTSCHIVSDIAKNASNPGSTTLFKVSNWYIPY
jgi:hypothetical protein